VRRTKSGLPKHCTPVIDRHGKSRVRFRKSGFSTYLTGTPWSEDFMRQYATALDGVKAQATTIGAERTKPGSFDALCVSYYRSPDFLGLRPSTLSARRHVLERFRQGRCSADPDASADDASGRVAVELALRPTVMAFALAAIFF
jgi:hypothetical protein